jgi:hypothetical protein
MAAILTESFDSYSDGDLNGQGSWSGDVQFDIQGTTTQSGAKAVTVTPGAAIRNIKKTGTAQNTGSQIIYMRAAQTNQKANVQFLDNSDNVCADIYFDTDGNLKRDYGAGGGSTETLLASYSANTWYKILTEWSSSDHKWRVTIDSNTPSSYQASINANIDTANKINLQARNGGTFYYDSLQANAQVISVSDSIAMAESKTVNLTFSLVDSISFSEALTLLKKIIITVSDSIALVENLAVKAWGFVAKNSTNWSSQNKSSTSWSSGNKNSTNWTETNKD